ncbi:hypothetical protein [Miltoncostaea marina]|uniref:hypothetical protein n=1 Tax=Miltoncostaea marina TaxID=2843215 RepID=UPI001C3DD3EF|nr:hypothetical protein [Miltoncostaea marina]
MPAAPAAPARPSAARARAPGGRSTRPRPVVVRAATRVVERAAEVGRSPWLIGGVIAAAVLYLAGQRALDRGHQLASAGRGDDPDDQLIDL